MTGNKQRNWALPQRILRIAEADKNEDKTLLNHINLLLFLVAYPIYLQ